MLLKSSQQVQLPLIIFEAHPTCSLVYFSVYFSEIISGTPDFNIDFFIFLVGVQYDFFPLYFPSPFFLFFFYYYLPAIFCCCWGSWTSPWCTWRAPPVTWSTLPSMRSRMLCQNKLGFRNTEWLKRRENKFSFSHPAIWCRQNVFWSSQITFKWYKHI